MTTGNSNSVEDLGSVSVWLRQLPDGAREAQNEILNRYREQVVGYARHRLLMLGVRSKDADDVAQEVFMGLFQRAKAGKLPNMNNRDELWLKLRRITGDRVIEARRKKIARTESAIDVDAGTDVIHGIGRIADEDLHGCLVTVEHAMLRRLLAERHRDLPEIAKLKMQGFAVQEIADQLHVAKRTVERRLAWINEICDKYLTT